MSAEHLFISYATEEGVLAEWLTRKLTAEGYRVWCDRFKLLGGESYPRDIDEAIKNDTFRMIALLSRASIAKPNPTKERTLALNIGKERKIDFLIPLNVEGLKATELDWMTGDLTFIPFHESWASGLDQLLKKLADISTPCPLTRGKQVAAATFLPTRVLTQAPEVLWGNFLCFRKIPSVIKRFKLSRDLDDNDKKTLSTTWAFYWADAKTKPRTVLSLQSPPATLPEGLSISSEGGAMWEHAANIDGIDCSSIVSAVLSKSMDLICHTKGIQFSPTRRPYFPAGLLEKDKIYFVGCRGVKTWVQVCGERNFRIGDKPPQKNYYHISPEFRVRQDLSEPFVMRLRIALYITDAAGQPLPPRSALSRRKAICKNWWNDDWANRLLAVCNFLADGNEVITIGDPGDEQIVLGSNLAQFKAPFGIDEAALSARTSDPDSADVEITKLKPEDEVSDLKEAGSDE